MEKIVNFKGYSICRWIEAFIDDDVVGCFDSMAEAKSICKGTYCDFRYAAAELINDDGDTNPSVYGSTLSEVMNKIKKILL